MCGRPIGLNVAGLGVLLFAVAAGASRTRRLQGVCRCQNCVKAGNTAQQCAAFGIDCNCLVVCKCKACLDRGNSAKLCESFGLDCKGCSGLAPPPPHNSGAPPTAKGPWSILAMGFTVAADQPYFIKTTTQLFSIDGSDVSVRTQTSANGKIVYADSEHTAAEKLTKTAGLSGHIGPFSGVASMAIGSSTNSQIKTARIDAYYRCKKQRVTSQGYFRTKPSSKLLPAYVQFIKDTENSPLGMQGLADQLGLFYAKAANLGGVVQKSYTVEVTKRDTQSSVESELQASFGFSLLGGKASASGSVSSRKSRSAAGARVETSFHVEGGNTGLWLGLSTIPTDAYAFHKLQQKWAASVSSQNLYPFDVELHPIWEIVSHVDTAKGEALQTYLLAQWKKEASQFNPTKFYVPSACDKCVANGGTCNAGGHRRLKGGRRMQSSGGFHCVCPRGFSTSTFCAEREEEDYRGSFPSNEAALQGWLKAAQPKTWPKNGLGDTIWNGPESRMSWVKKYRTKPGDISLTLDMSHLGDAKAIELFKRLPSLAGPHLVYLNPRNNDLTDKSVPALAAALAHLPNLKALFLKYNHIGTAGCATIKAAKLYQGRQAYFECS